MFEYSPIINRDTKEVFNSYIKNLRMGDIEYVAIGVQDCVNHKTASLMSLGEWQQKFVENNYANYDPVRNIVLHTKRKLILLNEVCCTDSFGAEIMQQRKKFGIGNGFVLVERFKNFNYMLTFSTGYQKFNPDSYISNNYASIKIVIKDLKNIIYNDVTSYIHNQ
jgi:hypothetical protein